MVQPLQTNPSVASPGASEYLAGIPAASNGPLPVQPGFHDEAGVRCDEPGIPSFIMGAMRDVTETKAMEAELHEHRYRLERKVEQRTEQHVRRITLLESCNATLSGKLALAHRELAALKKQMAGYAIKIVRTNDPAHTSK